MMSEPPSSFYTIPEVKLAAINVNSLISLNKRYDLLQFLNSNNVDIALISETKLSSKYKIEFSDFNIIRNDRNNNNAGGGTAILIKRHIQFETISTPSSRNNQIVEYTIAKVKLKNNQYLFMISIHANNKDQSAYNAELSP